MWKHLHAGGCDLSLLQSEVASENPCIQPLRGAHRVLEDLALYGRRTRARPRENFVFAYLVKVYANITALMPALEMKHYLSSDYSINATRWYPTARRLYGVYRLLQSRDAVAAMADAHLRRLEPGDAQPPPEGA